MGDIMKERKELGVTERLNNNNTWLSGLRK